MSWASHVRFPVSALNYSASVRSSGVNKKTDQGESPVRLCNYTDVYYNERITEDLDFMSASASGLEISDFSLRPGDVVITKDSETADDIAIPALVAEPLDNVVLGYHSALIRATSPRLDPRFLFWVMASAYSASYFETKARGVTRVGLRTGDISDFPVPTPPLETQRRIADMLDAETARIDELIERCHEALRVLELRRQSLIEDLISGGESVDRHGWASPDEWGRIPVRDMTNTLFTDGDWVELPHITDEGVRLIQTGNVGVGRYREQGYRYISEDSFEELRCTEVLPGDILVSRLADPVGRACVAPDLGVPMITSVDVAIVRPGDGVVPEFVVLTMSSQRWLQRVSAKSRGGTRDRIARLALGNLRVPMPDPELQGQIVAEWTASEDDHGDLQDKLRRQIELLETRRRSLITAAVTGQINV